MHTLSSLILSLSFDLCAYQVATDLCTHSTAGTAHVHESLKKSSAFFLLYLMRVLLVFMYTACTHTCILC